jgi:hypothetical protein
MLCRCLSNTVSNIVPGEVSLMDLTSSLPRKPCGYKVVRANLSKGGLRHDQE